MADTFNVHEAKTHLSELLERARAGEEIVIAKANRPVAKLVAIAPRPRRRVAGLDAGAITYIAEDFDAPLPDEIWEGRPNDPLNTWIRERAAARRGTSRRRRAASGGRGRGARR